MQLKWYLFRSCVEDFQISSTFSQSKLSLWVCAVQLLNMSGEKGPPPNINEDTHVGGDIMDEFEYVHGENVECIDEPIDCQLKAPDEKL